MKRVFALLLTVIMLLNLTACSIINTQLPSAEQDWRAWTPIDGYRTFIRNNDSVSVCICILDNGIKVYYNETEQKTFGTAEYPEFFDYSKSSFTALDNSDINEDGNSDITALFKLEHGSIKLCWIFNPETEVFEYSTENSDANVNGSWYEGAEFQHDVKFSVNNRRVTVLDSTVHLGSVCDYSYSLVETIDDAHILTDKKGYVIARHITEDFNNSNLSPLDYVSNYTENILGQDIKTLYSLSDNLKFKLTTEDTSDTLGGISCCYGTVSCTKFSKSIKTHIYIDIASNEVIAKTIVADTSEKITQMGSEAAETFYCS